MPQWEDKRLLVGSATADDAGVFALNARQALVQTTDFFTPIVDDPFLFGKIAAANALSDVYAMGGRPLSALAIAAMPVDVLPQEDIHAILKGGAEACVQAQCVLLGGHTIKNPEPIYGLAVTGLVAPDSYLANAHAKPHQALLLTKPLGSGILSTAAKQGKLSKELIDKNAQVMATLNIAGAPLAEKKLTACCTDITGFGLAGHLLELCQASRVSANISAHSLPLIDNAIPALIDEGIVPGGTRKNLETITPFASFSQKIAPWQKLLFADAQTSGGLLFSIEESQLHTVAKLLEHLEVPFWHIGHTAPLEEGAPLLCLL